MGGFRFGHRAMHTQFALLLESDDEEVAEDAAAACWELVDRLDTLLSRFRYGSDLSILNSVEKPGLVRVAAETLACLKVAADAHTLSFGVFDVTINPVWEVYRNVGVGRGVSEVDLEKAKQLVGRDGWAIEDGKVRVKRVGMQLDLGGIAKGFALDRMAAVLKSHGIESALINTGQSTLLATDAKAWLITPSAGKEKLTLSLGALSSSSNPDGQLIDPRTSRRAESSWLSVMVKAPTAALADALSTAFMLLHEQQVREVCQADPKIAARLYRESNVEPIKVGQNPF